jgi:sugar-specific transcriptional regulator TrmB
MADLSRYGLTRVEEKVYMALLQNGSQQAGAITKVTGIHRRTVYDAISRLIEKGLVSYIKSGSIKVYQAAHPERLLELLKEQENILSKDLPQLEALYESRPGRHETVFYRGKKGLKVLFDDQLKSEQEVLMQGATPVAIERLQFYFPHYDRTRLEKKQKIRMLFDQRIKGKSYVQDIPLAETRVMKTAHPQDVVTCIYGDSVAIITFAEKPFGILIREHVIAEQYRNYFEILWKQAKLIGEASDRKAN